MSFTGHLGAGAGFLVVGLWQAYVCVKSYRLKGTRPSSSQGYVPYAEHVVVALLAVLHMIFSLISSLGQNQHNGASVGMAVSLEKLGVAAMFFLYAIVALISESTKVLPLPSGMVELLAIFAFGEEFLLFHSTISDGSPIGLEVQYFSLLLVPIGVCLVATLMEIIYPAAILPLFIRGMALILQGTWFFQMAASLFTKWLPEGCDLVQKSAGDYTVTCEGMSLMRARALATLEFNCHLALLLLFLLPTYAIMCKIYTGPSTYERLGGSRVTEEVTELYEENGTGQELSQADYFHVLEEDEEEKLHLPKDLTDTNSFQRVNI